MHYRFLNLYEIAVTCDGMLAQLMFSLCRRLYLCGSLILLSYDIGFKADRMDIQEETTSRKPMMHVDSDSLIFSG